MPDVKEAETEQVAEETENQDSAVASPEGKKASGNLIGLLSKVAIIAVVALVAIFAAYMVTMKVLKPMLASNPEGVEMTAEEPSSKDEESKGEEGEAAELLYEVDDIIVNPASTVGSRFLSCSVAFEVESQEDLTKLESIDVKLRDALITILSARTVDELADARLREPLRRQIMSRVNMVAAPVKVKAVYFKNFVLQ